MGSASRESEGQGGALRLRFPARAESLKPIRRALERIGLPEPVLRDALLLTTELVTNSIRHADLGPDDHVDVTAHWSDGVLHVAVDDSGSRSPPAGIVAGSIRPSPTGRSGWGLFLVDRLATRWGTNLGASDGFWFELEVPRREGSSRP
jgi:anti-sigma regulatory factor (Ser/Thr protein kinase)